MEIMVVGVLALIVFGPDKLPEIARTVGGFMKQLRAMADDVKQEFSEFEVGDEPDDDEVAALAENDSEVARLDEKEDASDSPDDDVGEVKAKPEPDDADQATGKTEPEEPDQVTGKTEPEEPDQARAKPEPTTDGYSDHPVAGAIEAEREKSSRIEGG
jgi:sec-independent protein translocase protein TatB